MLWNNVLQPLVSWIISEVAPTFQTVFKIVGDVFRDVFSVVSGVIGGIWDALSGLIDFWSAFSPETGKKHGLESKTFSKEYGTPYTPLCAALLI